MSERTHLALPFAASALFAGSFIAAQYTATELTPVVASLLRYAVALIALTSFVPFHAKNTLRIQQWIDVPMLGMLGLFGVAGYHWLFFTSLRYTDVTSTAIINASSPVVTAVLAAVVSGERLQKRSYAGLALSVSGVVLLLSRGNPSDVVNLRMNQGNALMVGAVGSWAVYSLAIKRLVHRYTGFALTFHATLSGVVLLLLLALREDLGQIRRMSPSAMVAIGYMGVFASGAGYLFYNLSVRSLGPTRTAGVVYGLVPILVSLLSLVLLGRRMNGLVAASMGLVLLGLWLLVRNEDGLSSHGKIPDLGDADE